MMHKYFQIIKNIYIQIFILIMIFILIIFINSYSSLTGLFTEFDIKVSGNKYIDTIIIENEIYPKIRNATFETVEEKKQVIDFIWKIFNNQ